MKQGVAGKLAALGLLGSLAAGACLLRVLVDRDPAGGVSLAWPEPAYAMFRWTAVAVGALVGAALATSGVLLQALLRNPLAEPFILGLSSGAGLGVMIAMYMQFVRGSGVTSAMGHGSWAIGGALAVLAVVYALGQRRGRLDPVTLVLVGVVICTICGAGIMFLQHLVPTGLRGEFTLWIMGTIPEAVGDSTMWLAFALTAAGVGAAAFMGRAMDAATLGDDEARSIGLSLGRLRAVMFIAAGMLAAIAVALAGPIGFIGLIAPHAARLVIGPRHGLLVVGAALLGVAIVVGADAARQTLHLGSGRMPIGVFTAVIGGPAFIWLMLSGRGQS